MTVKEQVLNLLEADKGSYLSGQDIARSLFVSRNAVWKAIESLRSEGHIIEAVTNRGYRLSENSCIFSGQSVSACLEERLRSRIDISIVKCTGSTIDDLKAAAENGAPEGTVIIALKQTRGKGRLGRKFESPMDSGLYMSVLLRPKLTADKALFITTCAAVAVSEAIDKVSGRKSQIKWVNDVYLDGLKVCGILTEASMDFESGGLNYAVLGIGVNITAENFPEELKGIAGGISDGSRELRPELASAILSNFFKYYDILPDLSFLPEYRRRSLLIGKEIEFTNNGTDYSGTAIDIDDKARLVVRCSDGEIMKLYSGEAILKKGTIIK